MELGRRRALLEMAQICGPGADDESIRQRVLAYLEKSEFDEQLDSIVDDIDAQDLVPGLLDDIASAQHAQNLRGQVVRFLESYPDHPSLLLLRAVIECICQKSDPEIVRSSMTNWAKSLTATYKRSLRDFAESYSLAMKTIGRELPDIVTTTSYEVLTKSNDKEFQRHVLANPTSQQEREIALTCLLEDSLAGLGDSLNYLRDKI